MKIQCLIADDEPIALEVVERHLQSIPGVEVVHRCTQAMDAFQALVQQPVDVMFLDIEMPGMNGIDFVKSLKNPPEVVFTSAYSHYAVEGFNLDAADYLLKPISRQRMAKAIDKVLERKRLKQKAMEHGITTAEVQRNGKPYFFIKTGNGLTRIDLDKTLAIEGWENYVKIVCENKTYVAHNTMKKMESMLSDYNFIRIHKSFIINLNKVQALQDAEIMVEDRTFSIGKSYRKEVKSMLMDRFALQ